MNSTTLCIRCGANSTVRFTRRLGNGWRKRRRKCPGCGAKWNTFEVPQSHIKKMLDGMGFARAMLQTLDRLKAGVVDTERLVKEFGTAKLKHDFMRFKSRIEAVEQQIRSVYGEQTVEDLLPEGEAEGGEAGVEPSNIQPVTQ